jgi:hypothetical protein
MDLNQLRGQYDQHLQKYNQNVKEYEDSKKKLTGDSVIKDAELHRLWPIEKEYKNYRRDVSPLRREHPQLKDFYNRYKHVKLDEYAKIPTLRKALQNAPGEAAALYKDAVDFYNSRHKNSYGKDYPGTISWGKKFGLL